MKVLSYMKVGLVKIGLKGENNEISKIGVWLAPRKKDYRNQSLQSKLQNCKKSKLQKSIKVAKLQKIKIAKSITIWLSNTLDR